MLLLLPGTEDRVRTFRDHSGDDWVATVDCDEGTNYKGRWFFKMKPEEGDEDDAVHLTDVRWNSERTARRTLETMSEVELRRRLRSARGRSISP